jgi:hypothetical protein
MGSTLSKRLSITLQGFVFMLLVYLVFANPRPPAEAQSDASTPKNIVDALQDRSITQLNEHLRATDASVSGLQVKVDANTVQIAEMHGQETVWFALLAVMVGGSIVFQVSSNKKAKDESK